MIKVTFGKGGDSDQATREPLFTHHSPSSHINMTLSLLVEGVLEDARKIVGLSKEGFPMNEDSKAKDGYIPQDPKEFAG